MKKYFAISDIHGREITLEDFENKGFDIKNEKHIMVFLGDYFDRGVENYKVLHFLEDMHKTLGKDRCKLLIGNHDEFLIDFLDKIRNFNVGDELYEMNHYTSLWISNGGNTTLRELFGSVNTEYTQAKKNRVDRLLNFVSLLEPYYETEEYIFTHAAINEDREIDTWDIDIFHKGVDIEKIIVIGHTPHIFLEDFYTKGNIAISNNTTKCSVYNIDDGTGENIVVL